MSVTCDINIISSPNGKHRPGDTIQGNVTYIMKKDVIYSDITISLKGKGHVRIGNYIDKEKYIIMHKHILASVSKDAVVLTTGTHVVNFEFVLPRNLPSTYCDINCNIHYYIRVKLVSPGFVSKKRKYKRFFNVENSTIIKPDIMSLTNEAERFLIDSIVGKNKNITLKATRCKEIYSPGDTANITLELVNNTDVVILTIAVKIYEDLTYIGKNRGSNFSTTKRSRLVDIIESNGPFEARSCKTIDVKIPTSDKWTTIKDHTEILRRVYVVIFTVKMPFPRRDLLLEMPLIIGHLAEDIS